MRSGSTPKAFRCRTARSTSYLSFQALTKKGRRMFGYLFHKDPREMGQWVPLDNLGSPAIVFNTDGATVSLATGGAFFAAVRFQDRDNSYTVTRGTWDWTIRNWRVEKDVESGTSSGVSITAGPEYYLLVAYTLNQARAQARLAWVDPLGHWHEAAPLNDDLRVNYHDRIYLTAGPSMVAVGCLAQTSPVRPSYTLAIYQWNEHYTLARKFSQTFTQTLRRNGFPAAIVPQVSGGRMVLCGENVVLFDGAAWHLNHSLVIPNPAAASEDPWYAVGDDYVIRTIPSNSNVIAPSCKLLTYDPDTDTTTWSSKALIEPQPPLQFRQHNPSTASYPTASASGYFTSDKYLYARGQASGWGAGIQQPLFTMPDNLDTKAILNESPHFVAYGVPNQDLAKSVTEVIILHNGKVTDTEKLTGEKYWTVDERTSANSRYPAGPASLVTYNATTPSFDKAQSFTLYRFAGDSITKNLTHHPVASISVSDGFNGLQETAYTFDPTSASCDSSGKLVKYYKSTTYHGCSDPDHSRAGRTETYYINGYRGGKSPYFYMLDGMIDKILSYDNEGKLVASNQQTWTVYTSRNRSPLVKDSSPLVLNGTYSKLTVRETVKDGVTTTTVNSYVPTGFDAPFSGQELGTSVTIHNTRAVPETHTKTKRFGYEVYPGLARNNWLSAVVQTTQSVSVNGAAPIPNESKVTTYVPWTARTAAGNAVKVMDVSDLYHWRGGASVEFPFGSAPNDATWLRKRSIVARTSSGLVTETKDAMHVPTSMLYDTKQEFVIATFGNTSISGEEGAYCGFEPYMSMQGWTIQGTATCVAGDAHTGANSLQLPAGGSGTLSITLTPARQRQRYILGWWYKTGSGFAGESRSGWIIKIARPGASDGRKIVAPFQDTGGKWSYACQVIDLDDDQASLTVQVTASNFAAMPVLLDDVSISPFPASVVAGSYDTDSTLLLSETHLGGKTLRYLFDRFQRKMGGVGQGEQVLFLTAQYASRRGNDGLFSSREPNSLVQMKARNGGSCDQFQTGEEWHKRWTAGGTWTAADGALSNTGAATLALVPAELSPNFALMFELTPRAHITSNIGVLMGSGTVLEWQASTNQWSLTMAGKSVTALAQPGRVARQWLLIRGDRSLLFFADGQLAFSCVDAIGPISSLQLTTGADFLSLRMLTLLKDPIVSVEYHDAAGRKRQSQVLLGDDSLVAQTIYDHLGKQVAVTKQTPGSFGRGAALPLLAYREKFVDVSDFLGRLDTDGIMRGDVGEYYRGQIEPASGLPRSDDESYPYTRIRYEASPLGRKSSAACPGKTGRSSVMRRPLRETRSGLSMGQAHRASYPGSRAIRLTATSSRPGSHRRIMPGIRPC